MDTPKRLRKEIFARESEPKPQAAMIPEIESSVVVSNRQSFSNWTRWTSCGIVRDVDGVRLTAPHQETQGTAYSPCPVFRMNCSVDL